MKARWSQFVGKLSGIPEKIQQQNALEKRVAYSFSQVLNLTELWAFSTPVSQLWQNPSSPGKLSIGKSFTTPMALLLGAITVLLTNQARFPEILQRSSKLNSHKPEKLLLCKKNFEGTLIPDFLFSILSVTTSQVLQELTEFGRVWFFLYVQNSHRLLESHRRYTRPNVLVTESCCNRLNPTAMSIHRKNFASRQHPNERLLHSRENFCTWNPVTIIPSFQISVNFPLKLHLLLEESSLVTKMPMASRSVKLWILHCLKLAKHSVRNGEFFLKPSTFRHFQKDWWLMLFSSAIWFLQDIFNK